MFFFCSQLIFDFLCMALEKRQTVNPLAVRLMQINVTGAIEGAQDEEESVGAHGH